MTPRCSAALSAGWSPELVAHRRFLLGLARLQLGGGEADDVVHDTLIAAAEGADRFSGKVPLRAWLSGILRHKIVDALRARHREEPLVQAAAHDDEEDAGRRDAADFGDSSCPEEAVFQRQMLARLELCLDDLPQRSARLLLMHDYLGMSTEEIADQTALTPGNLRVLLHRARMRIRQCWSMHWGDVSWTTA